MNNVNLYDQSNIPEIVYERMKELKEIEDQLKEYNQLIERKSDILNEIESIFPKENNAIAVHDGLTLYWKMGKRMIGKAELESLEKIDPFLVRTIPEKVIPSERKAQTLTRIEEWMEYKEIEDGVKKAIYNHLNIKQSKSLISERI